MRKHYGDLPNLTIRTHITGYSKNPHDLSAWHACVTLDAYRNVDGKVDRSFKISETASTWELAVMQLVRSVEEHFRDMELEFKLDGQGVNNGTTCYEESPVGQFEAIAERLENSLLGIHQRLDKLEQSSEMEQSHGS
jgi:hypothetical protein